MMTGCELDRVWGEMDDDVIVVVVVVVVEGKGGGGGQGWKSAC